MQFYMDGFKPGDPFIAPESPEREKWSKSNVDVLIVGCGPAGLTLAAQLSAFADINTRVIDSKNGPLQMGQADGLACRTLEMFEAFNFSDRVIREAYNVVETVFWSPDPATPQHITRSGRIQDVEDDLSEFPHLILSQARVHDMFLQKMVHSPCRLQPDYSHRFISLEQQKDKVAVVLEQADGAREAIKAKYVIGCDGARSQVRQSIGLALEGDSANQAWGVMDVLVNTDFPDIRFKSVIRSSSEGNILIIPREGGYLVRLYIELEKLAPDERVSSKELDVSNLINAAQRIFKPYTFEVKDVVWWSAYEIGQRLCNHFDNAGRDNSDQNNVDQPRVFIAGDACHTHSPKAGQGMNVSMADSFNLGWKLASVLRGLSPPALLKTYSAERQHIAKELIEFDRHWAARFSETTKESDEGETKSMDAEEFQNYFTQHGRYTAGVSVKYPASVLVASDEHQKLAAGLIIGMRFHSALVTRVADAEALQLGHTVEADGRWRLFAFASHDYPSSKQSPVWQLCDFLATDADSPLQKYNPAGADPDSVIDFNVVFQQAHHEVNIHECHPVTMPTKGKLGVQDINKVFSAEVRNHRNIYDARKISRTGCVVVVRPDQFVADVMPLTDFQRLSEFFVGILNKPDHTRTNAS
ncbi:phenol 2-monooxygenase [Chromatiales bacterium (ex Bugula neritina AB1)]|nr:phenol 2-monooxygenase [Chromatiales bacterium (ex Bugula neritina AB1)]